LEGKTWTKILRSLVRLLEAGNSVGWDGQDQLLRISETVLVTEEGEVRSGREVAMGR